MTRHAAATALDATPIGHSSLLGFLRDAGAMPWLGNRAAYTFGAPVLSLAGAAATVAAPLLLAPSRFGEYILLLSVFQYACASDLGLSQLADKALTGRAADQGAAAAVSELVCARVMLVACLLLLAVPLAFGLARGGALTAANLLVAAVGGIAFMLSNGPVSLYRAGSRVWEFTFAALLMQAGLSLPRLGGLVAGGVTGSFAALAAWYVLTAALLTQPLAAVLRARPPMRVVARTLRVAAPLFAFNALWLLYLTANRWVSAKLSTPGNFGLFAFGANLVAVGVGVLSTVGQVHYPKHLVAAGAPGASVLLRRELLRLLGVAMAGTAAGVLACRYAVPVVFPQFAAAAAPSGALMAAGVPLSLTAWVLPLAIATSARPWRDAAAMFSVSLAVLGAAMWGGDMAWGIVGQAWGCALAAIAPFGAVLMHLMRSRMLSGPQCRALLGLAAAGVAADGVVWLLLFQNLTRP